MSKIRLFFVGALAALLLSSGQPKVESRPLATMQDTTTKIVKTVGVDHYYIERNTVLNLNFKIRIIRYNDFDKLGVDYLKAGGAPMLPGKRVMAWTTRLPNGDCIVRMIDPNIEYLPQYYGHEVIHCMYGDFHPNQPKKIH